MRLSSNFITGARDEQDRIRKQRKENREAFEKFKQLKVENGEQVTAEEFQQYRNSLSGGDAFFLRDLGPGELLDDLAKRTNQRSLQTRKLEDAKFVEANKTISETFSSWLQKNLDIDPTNKEAAKENFMMNFKDNQELGLEIWDMYSGRLEEEINTERANAGLKFFESQLKNVDSLTRAEEVMNKNNLPQWKKDAVRVYMQEKFNKVTTENRASLFKLAQDYAPANIREVQPEQLDAVVEGMIIQSKLDTSQYNTRELEQLKTDLKKIIQDNVNDAVEADTRVREDKFGAAIVSNKVFLEALKNGWKSPKVLREYNAVRMGLGLSVIETDSDGFPTEEAKNSAEYARFKVLAVRAATAATNNYATEYKEENEKTLKLSQEALDEAIKLAQNIASTSNNYFGTSGKKEDIVKIGGFIASSRVVGDGYVLAPGIEPSMFVSLMREAFGDDFNLNETNEEKISQMVQYMKDKKFMVRKPEFMLMRKKMMGNKKFIYPPGTSFKQEVVPNITKDFQSTLKTVIRNKLMQLSVFDNISSTFGDENKIQELILELTKNKDLVAKAKVLESQGAKGAFNDLDITNGDGNIKELLDKAINEVFTEEMGNIKNGYKLPTNFFSTASSSQARRLGIVVPLKDTSSDPSSPEYLLDSDGEPLKRGMQYTHKDGVFSKYPPTTTSSGGVNAVFGQITLDPSNLRSSLLTGGGGQFAPYSPGLQGIDRNSSANDVAQTIVTFFDAAKAQNQVTPGILPPSVNTFQEFADYIDLQGSTRGMSRPMQQRAQRVITILKSMGRIQ